MIVDGGSSNVCVGYDDALWGSWIAFSGFSSAFEGSLNGALSLANVSGDLEIDDEEDSANAV